MTDRDRRQEPRTPLPGGAVVRVRFKDKKQVRTSYAKDISRGGIFLRTKTPLPVFEQLAIVLELPDGQEVELKGEVVHAVPPDRAAAAGIEAGMGVQFVDLTADKRARLEEYLARARTVVPPPPDASPTRRPGEVDRRDVLAHLAGVTGVEDLVHALRRLAWMCADATQLASCDYYELLGVEPNASAETIRGACDVLRALCDPANPPPGVASGEEGTRFQAVTIVLEEIEACLTDPRRRAEYDVASRRILR